MGFVLISVKSENLVFLMPLRREGELTPVECKQRILKRQIVHILSLKFA